MNLKCKGQKGERFLKLLFYKELPSEIKNKSHQQTNEDPNLKMARISEQTTYQRTYAFDKDTYK